MQSHFFLMTSCLFHQRTKHTGVVLAWWGVGGTGDNQPSAPVTVHQQPGPAGRRGQRVSRAAEQAVLQKAVAAVGSGQGHRILQLLLQGCQDRRRHHRRPSLCLCQRWVACPAIRQHVKRLGVNQSLFSRKALNYIRKNPKSLFAPSEG